jgi:uncharacterized protein
MIPSSEPLNERELDFMQEMLLEYGNDDSVLDISELDGYLTAIVSGPDMIPMSVWYPALWGGADKQAEFASEKQLQKFLKLLLQHMNNNAVMLMNYRDEFEAMFNFANPEPMAESAAQLLIAEEWCFGYMRGVALCAGWADLPEQLQPAMASIRLHGTEECFDAVEALSIEEHQDSVRRIEPAARELYSWWLSQRMPQATARPSAMPAAVVPYRAEQATGRNELCPCGSGKKFKKCCLH